jgi:16S rRNA processing protein RimM
MEAAADDLLPVGVTIGTHGLRGDLKVRPLSDDASALLAAAEIFLRCRQQGPVPYRIVSAKEHKANVLLRFQGCDSIDAVQSLVGCEVLMRRSDLPALSEAEYYWFELEGLNVRDRRYGDLGILEEMFSTAAHDIYVVHGRFGEILVPAVEEFIVEVDREGRRMLVDLPEGLVPENNEI